MSQTILVREFMTPSPHSIAVTRSLGDAIRLMREFEIRHLPVLDGGSLVGVVSERDVQMIETVATGDAAAMPIEEAMSQSVYTVSPNTPLQVCALHMLRHKLGSAVVMQGPRVVGVFTTTDALRALADLLGALDERPTRLSAITNLEPTALAEREAGELLIPPPKTTPRER